MVSTHTTLLCRDCQRNATTDYVVLFVVLWVCEEIVLETWVPHHWVPCDISLSYRLPYLDLTL